MDRTRLANKLWIFVRDRGSIAVPPHWRTSDPRIPWIVAPTGFAPQDANYSQDRAVPYAIQQKYTNYDVSIRVASKLEADYIKAEAEGTAAQLALIQARRAAQGQSPFSGADPDSILTEFFTQKGFDFYLEGKRMGDFRRHPGNIFGLPVAGSTYWKPGFAPVGNQECYPLPILETDNNPNFNP